MKNYRLPDKCSRCKHCIDMLDVTNTHHVFKSFCNVLEDVPNTQAESYRFTYTSDWQLKHSDWQLKHKVDDDGICDLYEEVNYV